MSYLNDVFDEGGLPCASNVFWIVFPASILPFVVLEITQIFL